MGDEGGSRAVPHAFVAAAQRSVAHWVPLSQAIGGPAPHLAEHPAAHPGPERVEDTHCSTDAARIGP